MRRSHPPTLRPVNRKRPVELHEDGLQRRLEQAEARYRDLVESLPIITYVSAMDVQGSFTYISPQVEALLGFKPEEWLAGRSLWLKRMHPDDRQRLLPVLPRAHRAGAPFSAEYRLLDRSGRARWVKDESRMVYDRSGRPLFIQGTWTDVTEYKRMERETAGKGRELASSQSELEQFVSIASHELNAPLRRIVNLGETLALRSRGRLDAQAEGFLAQMIESAATMQKLLLGLVQYAEAPPRSAFSSVDLDLVLSRVLKELAGAIAASGAKITYEDLPKVWAEPTLLGRVLFNLLDNAIKFHGAEPPRVHISAKQAGKEWVISVRDNGIGIHQPQARRIFSIFDRLNTREYAGIGLGLAVCTKIVERLGGRIWVESEPGEGSTFHFTARAPAQGASA